MRVCLVFVVLQDEHDGQFPDRRQVERLEERSLFARAVSEEAVDDLSCAFHLSSQRGPRSMGNTLTDNGGRARKIVFGIGKMHGAAKTLAQPVFPSIELRHHFLW